MHRGSVDVAAKDGVGLMVFGLGRQRLLKRADIVDRILDFQLRPFGERPVRRTKDAPTCVENAIGGQRKLVGLVAEQREPARLRHHQVEDVAVDHQVASSVDAFVNCVLDDFDAAEMRAVIAAQKFVVIARDVDDAGAFAR